MAPHNQPPGKAPLDLALWDDEDVVDADEFMRQTLAANLKAARETVGLTQAQLAAKLGQSQSLIGAAERGAIDVKWDYTRALLEACGLPENWKPARESARPR